MGQFKTTPSTQLAVTENEVFATGRMKFYPDCVSGIWEIGSFEFFEGNGAFRRKGFEVNREWSPDYHTTHVPELDEVTFNPITGQQVTKWGYEQRPDKPPKTGAVYDTASGNDKGRRRAVTRVFDYVRCNWDMDCMFTLTFDKEKIDRTSYEDIVKQVGQWFSNRVRRSELKYIAIPEYHADGEAIHFHGVCNFEALKTVWSGVVQKGKRVYNITDFPFGHTAVKRMGGGDNDRHAVAVYVSKYITKDTRKVGGRYYLHGGKLEKPREILCGLTREEAEEMAKHFSCSVYECNTPNGGRYVKYEVQHFETGE